MSAPTVSDIAAIKTAGQKMVAGGQALIGGAKKLAKKLSKKPVKKTVKKATKKTTKKKTSKK
jgi:regulator of replication initiation timing